MKFTKVFVFMLAIVSLGILSPAQTRSSSSSPKPKVVHQDEFFVVGIEARTTAAKEMSPDGVIPQQWQRFMQEGVMQKIPNRADQNLYAVYTDFTNKRSKAYSVVIGAKVTNKSQVPAGLVLKTIPAGKYAIFQSCHGPAAQVIPAAWQRIADSEDKGQLGFTRAYKADYELFDARALDPQNLRAELHVGVN